MSDPGDALLVELWLVLVAGVAVLGLLTAPAGTSTAEDDAAAISGILFADVAAVVVTAAVWGGAGASLAAAMLQASPRLAQDAFTSWGVMHWAQSEYGAIAAELGDVDAQAEAEEDVAPLARTLVRAAAAATAQRLIDTLGDGYREDEDEDHGEAGGTSRRQRDEVALPAGAVAAVASQLKAQAQLLAQGLALPDPSFGSAALLRGAFAGRAGGDAGSSVGLAVGSGASAAGHSAMGGSVGPLQAFQRSADGREEIPLVSLQAALRPGARGGWNMGAEVMGRVWLAAWDGVLGRGCGEATAVRWARLKAEAASLPASRTLQHARAPGQVVAMRLWVEEQLEGPDVFWDGAMEDGSEPSESRFGTLTVVEFPWRCVLAFDDCDAVCTLWDEDLPSLVARNADPAIGARRLIRRQLRALHDHSVVMPVDRVEQHEVADGLHTFTDAETGLANTTERRVPVNIRVRYKQGVLQVKRRDNGELFSRGFSVSIVFRDGRGAVQAPQTKAIVELRDLYLVLGSEEAGVTPDFDMTEPLRRLLRQDMVVAALARRLPEVEEEFQTERRRRAAVREQARWLVDPAILAELYAGVGQEVESLDEVAAWFHRWKERHGVAPDAPVAADGGQAPPPLPQPRPPGPSTERGPHPLPRPASPAMCLPDTHGVGLRFVFARMQGLAAGGPLATLWFLTFSDAWRCNRHLPAVQRARRLLDDLHRDALCYRPMPREQLERVLLKHRLLGRSRLFTPEALDALFSAIADAHASNVLAGGSHFV